jgi:predicted alpha/beta hydrolase family esterase
VNLLSLVERVDRVALIAPPGPSAFLAPYRAFLPVGINRSAVSRASTVPPVVVSSDNDPYFPEGAEGYKATYTDAIGLRHHIVPGAGHIAVEDGFGPWPAVLAWCLDGTSDWARR